MNINREIKIKNLSLKKTKKGFIMSLIKKYAAVSGREEAEVYLDMFPAILAIIGLILLGIAANSIFIPLAVVVAFILVNIVLKILEVLSYSFGSLMEILLVGFFFKKTEAKN